MCHLKGSCKSSYSDCLKIKQNAIVTSQYLTVSLFPCLKKLRDVLVSAESDFGSRNLIVPCLNFILHKKK